MAVYRDKNINDIKCSDSSQIFRNLYINLYKEMRNYLWDFEVVELIAKLEIETHKTFPDIIELKNLVNNLERYVHQITLDDEYLASALDEFKAGISDNNGIVAFIKVFKEVNPI